jgi:LPPG:FO 2-phospho-L-lactate transferase
MIAVLTGGTGGAKLIEGLAAEIDPAELTIICNTGDDAVFHGLHVSPDIDTIIYTLAGIADDAEGWGIKDETSHALEQLDLLGADTWFRLGDRDLATHILRSQWLCEGLKLSEVTERLRRARGIRSTILPMSDERIETRVTTPQGEISFQEYFVKERWAREVTAVGFAGIDQSTPAPGVIEAIRNAEAVIICPSNPITSIGPILGVPGIRAALKEVEAPVVGVSPIIGTSAVSGPAHRLMLACGFEASAFGVAQCYRDFVDTLLIAEEDKDKIARIEKLGLRAVTTAIRMVSLGDKRRLARQVLASAVK